MILNLDRDLDHGVHCCFGVFFKGVGGLRSERPAGYFLVHGWIRLALRSRQAPQKAIFFFIFVSILFQGFLFLLVDVLCFASVADWLGVRRVDLRIYLLGATFGRRRTVFVGQGRR